MKITAEFLDRLRNWDLKSNIGIANSYAKPKINAY